MRNNTATAYLVFRIQTTAVDKYAVLPNAGVLGPGQALDIQVAANVGQYPQQVGVKCADRLQVLAAPIDAARRDDEPRQLWVHVAQDKHGALSIPLLFFSLLFVVMFV